MIEILVISGTNDLYLPMFYSFLLKEQDVVLNPVGLKPRSRFF